MAIAMMRSPGDVRFRAARRGSALTHTDWLAGICYLTARPAQYLLIIQSEGQQVPWTLSDMQHLMHGNGC